MVVICAVLAGYCFFLMLRNQQVKHDREMATMERDHVRRMLAICESENHMLVHVIMDMRSEDAELFDKSHGDGTGPN